MKRIAVVVTSGRGPASTASNNRQLLKRVDHSSSRDGAQQGDCQGINYRRVRMTGPTTYDTRAGILEHRTPGEKVQTVSYWRGNSKHEGEGTVLERSKWEKTDHPRGPPSEQRRFFLAASCYRVRVPGRSPFSQLKLPQRTNPSCGSKNVHHQRPNHDRINQTN